MYWANSRRIRAVQHIYAGFGKCKEEDDASFLLNSLQLYPAGGYGKLKIVLYENHEAHCFHLPISIAELQFPLLDDQLSLFLIHL